MTWRRLAAYGLCALLILLASVLSFAASVFPVGYQRDAAQFNCVGNVWLVDTHMARVMGQVSAKVGDMRCIKVAYHSDLVAAVEILPDSAPAAWAFMPIDGGHEVPVSLLFDLFPEAFAPDQRDGLTLASGFDPESRAVVGLIRRADARLFALIADY